MSLPICLALLISACCLSSAYVIDTVSLVASLDPSKTAATEGPAIDKDGTIYFSDTIGNQIVKVYPTDYNLELNTHNANVRPHPARIPSGRANGLAFDSKGDLYACEGAGRGGGRRVSVTDTDGTIRTVVDHYQGKPLNSPNDLVLDEKRGLLYFTDPRYGDRAGMEQPHECVYRVVLADRSIDCIISDLSRPNGIALSPDRQTLYVVNNNNDVVNESVRRAVYAYRLTEDGHIDTTVPRSTVYDFGTGRGGDGVCMDSVGMLYVAAGRTFSYGATPAEDLSVEAGIYVLHPELGLSRFISIPEDEVTNCVMKDAGDGTHYSARTVFVTAGSSLYQIDSTLPREIMEQHRHDKRPTKEL